jgi:DNA polymerase delta subunit 1
MPEAVAKTHKRILTDASQSSGNVLPVNSTKKRKVEIDELPISSKTPTRSVGSKAFGSSQPQPKSQFEEDLEKLTQDINGLKENNSEKDQQWDRPPLVDFDVTKDNLCFQQIDIEEGALVGKPALKLFGVTEVTR